MVGSQIDESKKDGRKSVLNSEAEVYLNLEGLMPDSINWILQASEASYGTSMNLETAVAPLKKLDTVSQWGQEWLAVRRDKPACSRE